MTVRGKRGRSTPQPTSEAKRASEGRRHGVPWNRLLPNYEGAPGYVTPEYLIGRRRGAPRAGILFQRTATGPLKKIAKDSGWPFDQRTGGDWLRPPSLARFPMVAIFAAAGAGLERGSGAVLGSAGLLGSSSLGRGGDQVFLSAATGNLIISQQDAFLVGLGLDAAITRTYNSLGDLSDVTRFALVGQWTGAEPFDCRSFFAGSEAFCWPLLQARQCECARPPGAIH